MKEDILLGTTIRACDVTVKTDGERLTLTANCSRHDWRALRHAAVEALVQCLRGHVEVDVVDMPLMELTDTARVSAVVLMLPEGEAVLKLDLTPCGEGGHRIERAVDEALVRALLAWASSPDPNGVMNWLPGVVELDGPFDPGPGSVVMRLRASWLLTSMCRGLHRTARELNDASAALVAVADELGVPVWGRREEGCGMDRCLIEVGYPSDAETLDRLDAPGHITGFLAESMSRSLEEAERL